jgi:hypothetical protein
VNENDIPAEVTSGHPLSPFKSHNCNTKIQKPVPRRDCPMARDPGDDPGQTEAGIIY